MTENRCNEMSSPSSASSSPAVDSTRDSKSATPRSALNAPKYGTPVPNRVFVGGIPSDANETEVKQLFAQYGNVTSVKIINDRAGVPRGYGFVTYEFEEDAKKVLQESDNLVIKDRRLNVSVAIKKQHFMPFEFGHRMLPNGTILYNPFLMNANSFLTDALYPAEGIPLYQLGVNAQYVGNAGTPSSYPYTYQNSGLYLTTQHSMPALTQYSTPQNYQFGCGAYRLPITSQANNMSANVANMSPFVQFSSATSPPLAQSLPMAPSSMQLQMASSHLTGLDCGHNMGAAVGSMSPVSIIQAPIYLSSSIPHSNSTQMACVQNIHLKATDSLDTCPDNSPTSGQQMVESLQWPLRVPNTQICPNKSAAINRTHNPSKSHNNASITASTINKQRSNNNSSVNASHNKKIGNNCSIRYTKGNNYAATRNNITYAYCVDNGDNANNQSIQVYSPPHQSNMNSMYGQPLIKHLPLKEQAIPVSSALVSSPLIGQQLRPKQTSSGQMFIPNVVNGVPIYTLASVAAGDGDYGIASVAPLTPPLGPHGPHSTLINSIHKT